MRGLNKVVLAGNVSGDIRDGRMPDESPVLSFSMAADRRTERDTITVWAKVNVYVEPLVVLCQKRLRRGTYVIVSGELMNRDGKHGKLTEVRAQEIIFVKGGGR